MLKRATKKSAPSTRKDRRLRAVYRRELQNSVQYSAIVVSAGAATTAAVGLFVAPGVGLQLLALLLPLSAAGVIVARQVRRRGRRYVIQLGMLIGLIPALAVGISVVLMPQFSLISLGTLGLVPVSFAVFIPLERRPHLVWLGLTNLVFVAVFGARMVAGGQVDVALALLFAAAVASACSLGANEVQLRRRRQMDGQLMAVRGLYGRMKEHEIDLRRQDEFLVHAAGDARRPAGRAAAPQRGARDHRQGGCTDRPRKPASPQRGPGPAGCPDRTPRRRGRAAADGPRPLQAAERLRRPSRRRRRAAGSRRRTS